MDVYRKIPEHVLGRIAVAVSIWSTLNKLASNMERVKAASYVSRVMSSKCYSIHFLFYMLNNGKSGLCPVIDMWAVDSRQPSLRIS